jgi:hypothetical protein
MAPSALVTLDASSSLDEINSIIERDGGVIVAKFLPRDVIEKAMSDGKDALHSAHKSTEPTKV